MERFIKIKEISAELIKSFKKIERLKKIELNDDATQKLRDKARININYEFIDIERNKHELHCLMVEENLALPESWRYGEKTFKPDGWHELRHTMREPVNVSETISAGQG